MAQEIHANHNWLTIQLWFDFVKIHHDLQRPILTTIQSCDREIQGYLLGAICYHCTFFSSGVPFPSGEFNALSHELENWIEQAIASYDNTPPSWVWATAFRIKQHLNKEEEAKQILAKHPEIKDIIFPYLNKLFY